MTVKAGLCPTWSEPKLLVFSRTGSFYNFAISGLGHDMHSAIITHNYLKHMEQMGAPIDTEVWPKELVRGRIKL